MIRRIALTLTLILLGTNAHAQLFSGPSFFSQTPFTQLGPIANNTLTLTDNPNGFVVTGVVQINVPVPAAGTLLSYTVDRPLNPAYGSNTLMTSTTLVGFSQPPVGVAGNTSGSVRSEFTNFPGVSESFIPITLTAGAAIWPAGPPTFSPAFVYTSGGVNFLRQRFDVDGVYISGPGGLWTVDVPVITTADTVVPEPATAGLVCLAIGFFGARRWRRCNIA